MSLLFDICVYINNIYRLLAFVCIISIKIWVQKMPTLYWIPGSTPLLSVQLFVVDDGFTILEGDALNVIEPISCSLVSPHWSILCILADIKGALLLLNFGLLIMYLKRAMFWPITWLVGHLMIFLGEWSSFRRCPPLFSELY